MIVKTVRITVATRRAGEVSDITRRVQEIVDATGRQAGIVTVFVVHTTAAIVVSEYEPGLVEDLPALFERLAPAKATYRHNLLNRDDNAHSHLLGTLLGPSVTVPIESGRLTLGVWQRIVLVELDTHPRSREIVVQVMGEP